MANIATISNLNYKFIVAIKYSRIIEPVLNFELSNKLLIWVAQKFMARSNVKLLLTKYYKERLKSQLKKKKTHKINQIANNCLLTELTELTKL